jgi:hypothetical protein
MQVRAIITAALEAQKGGASVQVRACWPLAAAGLAACQLLG